MTAGDPPPRRERLVGRERATGSGPRSGAPRSSRSARWAWTTTTTTRPVPAQRAAFEAQLALAREAGKAGGDPCPRGGRRRRGRAPGPPGRAGHPALVQQRPRPLAGGAGPPPLCVVQRDGDLQELAPGRGGPRRRRSTGCWSRPTVPTSRRCRTGASETSPRSYARWPSGSRRCAALPVEELIAATAVNAARVFRFPNP